MPFREIEKRREASRRYAAGHAEKIAASRKDKRSNNRKLVEQLKTDKPCVDCGIIYPPYVYDFDHIRGIKVTNIAALARDGTRSALLEEIAKCDLLCKNCHAHRTYMRAKNGPRTY